MPNEFSLIRLTAASSCGRRKGDMTRGRWMVNAGKVLLLRHASEGKLEGEGGEGKKVEEAGGRERGTGRRGNAAC